MRYGHFVLRNQTASVGRFASVAVRVTGAAADEISLSDDPRAVGGWGSVLQLGVAEGLEALRKMRVVGPVHVRVIDFVGLPTDTTEDDVRTAALLATLSAYLEPAMMPTPDFDPDEHRWVLRWA
jgi:hypothetical protein